MSSVTTYDPTAPALPAPPEDALYEIVDGRYEELPEMSTQAAVVASRLARRLGNFAEEKQLGEVVTEALFGLSPKARRKHRPEVAFVSYKRWPKDKPFPTTDPWPVVPELAVEVVSPNDLAEALHQKVKEYLTGGVGLVWLVYPQLGWVVAFESPHRVRGFTATGELDAEPILPGFRLPLHELFAQVEGRPPNGEASPEAGPTD
jgi:Uma2 family endonuclease